MLYCKSPEDLGGIYKKMENDESLTYYVERGKGVPKEREVNRRREDCEYEW